MARHLVVRGSVQGVGFRPYVHQLACSHRLTGWVLNGGDGVRIHVEGMEAAVESFVRELPRQPPPAAGIASIEVTEALIAQALGFEIRDSPAAAHPSTRVLADLPICQDCLDELFEPSNRRYHYPYINCTNCGPRFSIVRSLPYDRARTTMADWPLCEACRQEYEDPGDRRFHAQPVACGACGPAYRLVVPGQPDVRGDNAIREAARCLSAGAIVAVKGVGGYHLACDASNREAVQNLRTRKCRKEQAFALMVRDLAAAESTIELDDETRELLTSRVRPIVVGRGRLTFEGVAPDSRDLGVMLPYAPLHAMLFEVGAPSRLVMTSANRSSEPMAYRDEDALSRLDGVADAFLTGERQIARRVDDSIVRSGPLGPMIVRRARGLAPGLVATLPAGQPILALGADLKSAVTLVVGGEAYVSQHLGDLAYHDALESFRETVRDLLRMYGLVEGDVVIAHDSHPQYASTARAAEMTPLRAVSVQHHRAHIASVLAERGALDDRVIGVALDGTGYGDDGAIWGGELFVGSVREGFERAAHLRPATLVGGDGAAKYPVQAAAGFLVELGTLPDLLEPPFNFPTRYHDMAAAVRRGVRTFPTTSTGRLFDTAAALLGFTRPVSFEGQAAMWLEQQAVTAGADMSLRRMPFTSDGIDWRPALADLVAGRRRGVPVAALARAFHVAVASAVADVVRTLTSRERVNTVVLSGGVMQNALLVHDIVEHLSGSGLTIWMNRHVPPNDGGISLGQAAIASLS